MRSKKENLPENQRQKYDSKLIFEIWKLCMSFFIICNYTWQFLSLYTIIFYVNIHLCKFFFLSSYFGQHIISICIGYVKKWWKMSLIITFFVYFFYLFINLSPIYIQKQSQYVYKIIIIIRNENFNAPNVHINPFRTGII